MWGRRGAPGQDWKERQGEQGDPRCRREPPPALQWLRLNCQPGLGATASYPGAPGPRKGLPPGLCLLLVSCPLPGPLIPEHQPAVQGAHACGGSEPAVEN